MFAFSGADKAQIGVQNTYTVRHCSFPSKMQASLTNTALLGTETEPHGRSLLPLLTIRRSHVEPCEKETGALGSA